MSTGRLVLSVKKAREWIIFRLSDSYKKRNEEIIVHLNNIGVKPKDLEYIFKLLHAKEEIKILVRDHDSGNRKAFKVVIDCPKSIHVDRELNDSIGNVR